ncbi:PREDICTED: ribonuclease P protein subunit p14 [Tinamus guttatus]|nr:PREDICTED: ribonuclease P protein subunit p14 [Tinamus guttatus]
MKKSSLVTTSHGFEDHCFTAQLFLVVKHQRVGAALPVDVLTYEEKSMSAILRVISSGFVKLWSALTLLGFYQNRRCAFRVLQTSPFLLALSGNSRELVLD